MAKGWIKLHRELTDHWLWEERPFDKKSAWIDLLLMANHEEKKVLLGNEVVEVERGGIITSELKLADRWGWSRTKVRHFLEILESDSMIVVKKDSKKTAINLVNFSNFQNFDSEKDNEKTSKEHQENIKKTSKEHQKDTNNNVKNYKNEKNVKNVKKYISADAPEDFFPLDGKLDRTFRDFIRHREQIKQPMTENAVRLMIGKLEKMTTDNNEKIQILEESIMNGWKGIFPLKDGQKKQDGNVFLKLAREFAEEEGDGWFEGF